MAQSVQIKKVSWWHESIFEWMIANPESKLRECAEFFQVTQSWLSTIIHSDVFVEKLAERRDLHFAAISQDVASKVSGLAELSLDVLEERIERERDAISLGLVKDTAEMALKAAGYIGPRPGSNDRGGGDTNIFLPGSIDAKTLADSRELMNQRQIESTATEVEKE